MKVLQTGKLSKIRENKLEKMVLQAQIPTQGINYDNEIWVLNVMIGEERLCAEVTYKRMGTVSIGGKQ